VRQSVVKQGIAGSGASRHGLRVALGGSPKRAIDVAISVIALAFLAPILIGTGLLVRLLLGSPVVRAERAIGLGGRQFGRYMFRTTLREGHPASKWLFESDNGNWFEYFGKLLRRSDLDKLPQLVNVLLGDMSLVGPQPVAPQSGQSQFSEAPEVFLARPGLIGPCANPRNLPTCAIGVTLDGTYIRHWSMWLDVKIAWGALARVRADESKMPPR
jgi:lipopolysaccharide/colanic/teichoic acid biosynthesis glycosyltransferase